MQIRINWETALSVHFYDPTSSFDTIGSYWNAKFEKEMGPSSIETKRSRNFIFFLWAAASKAKSLEIFIFDWASWLEVNIIQLAEGKCNCLFPSNCSNQSQHEHQRRTFFGRSLSCVSAENKGLLCTLSLYNLMTPLPLNSTNCIRKN